MGSLLVGVSFAKGFARALGIPMIEVNHLQGHVLAHFIKEDEGDHDQPEFPFLCLLVSGGNSQIILVKAYNDMEVLGRLFLDFNEHLPEDYRGRPLAPSDVVELDCQGKRTYFYVNDCRDFAPVRFSPFLCKRLPEPAQKQE